MRTKPGLTNCRSNYNIHPRTSSATEHLQTVSKVYLVKPRTLPRSSNETILKHIFSDRIISLLFGWLHSGKSRIQEPSKRAGLLHLMWDSKGRRPKPLFPRHPSSSRLRTGVESWMQINLFARNSELSQFRSGSRALKTRTWAFSNNKYHITFSKGCLFKGCV